MVLHSHAAVLVALLAAPSVAFASGLQKGVRTTRITPELAPESDKKFFTKDYPDDKRPAVNLNFPFKHPYPAVQESINFDKDYVKDENGDGGKWNAQMTYDKLRNKIGKEKEAAAKAKETVEEERKELEEATDVMEKAKKAADEAEKNTEKARKKAEETTEKVNDLAGGNQTGDGAIGGAVHKVDEEIKHLEDCKKKLAETKEKLAKLMKEKAAREEQVEKEVAAEEEVITKERKLRMQDTKDKLSKEAELEAKESDALQEHEKLVNRLEEEKAEHKDALKSYEKELKDVEQTEGDLKEAQSRLRRFRKGGESEPAQKSGVVSAGLASAPVLIAILAVAATSSFSA